MGRRSTVIVALAVVALATPAFVRADDSGACSSDQIDAASQAISSVNQILRYGAASQTLNPSLRGIGEFKKGEEQTSIDIRNNRAIKTSDWPAEDQAAIEALLAKLPPCLLTKSGVGQIYRAQVGAKSFSAVTGPDGKPLLGADGKPLFPGVGFAGAVYSLQNGEFKGGRVFLSDLFFDKRAYAKSFTGDQQMQIALGLAECLPPDPRVLVADPALAGMTRERILFHEFTHGLVHQREGADRNNPYSIARAPLRFNALKQRYFRANTPLDRLSGEVARMETLPPTPENRARYCEAVKKRNDYLAEQRGVNSIPQRWPGDLHAMEDKDEYLTILLDTAKYDPTGGSFSAEELAWARGFLAKEFSGPECTAAAVVAQGRLPQIAMPAENQLGTERPTAAGIGRAPTAINDAEQNLPRPIWAGWFSH